LLQSVEALSSLAAMSARMVAVSAVTVELQRAWGEDGRGNGFEIGRGNGFGKEGLEGGELDLGVLGQQRAEVVLEEILHLRGAS
jgi:hypothetical protein